MRRLLTEPALREQLTSKGLDRAAHFSWDKAADETLQVYRNVENGSNGRHSLSG
jgi:glycosyltransferase involved in cell wall biosynthesis